MKISVLSILFLSFFSFASESLYKCVSDTNKVSYQDRECPQNSAPEIVKLKVIKPLEIEPITLKKSLSEGVRKGALRIASEHDLAQWKNDPTTERIKHRKKYVVLRPVNIELSLGGANAVVFIVTNKAFMPEGDLGHSTVLFTNPKACSGVLC